MPDLIEIKRLECDILLKLYYGSSYNTRESNYELFVTGIDDIKFRLKYDVDGFKLTYSPIFNFTIDEDGFYVARIKKPDQRLDKMLEYIKKMGCTEVEKLFIISACSTNNEVADVLPKELRDKIHEYCSMLGYIQY